MKKTFLLLFISISFLLLLFGYFNIQILNFSQWNPKAKNNSLRKIDIFAPRGIIYDSDNMPNMINAEYAPWKGRYEKYFFNSENLNNLLTKNL